MGRFYCLIPLLLLLVSPIADAQQKEVCPCGNDSPSEYGIKITMNPPLNLPAETYFWVPNQITVDVPSRLHPIKIELWNGKTGAEVTDTFRRLASTKHFNKVGEYARFQIQVNRCTGFDNAFQIGIYVANRHDPLGVNIQPFECKQRMVK
jgi:hypothetical protein